MPPPLPGPMITPLHDVQGEGDASPLLGSSVTVSGVVTGDYQNDDNDTQNNLGGFYIQEDNPDSNPATSDAVFVFDGQWRSGCPVGG